MGVQTVRRWPGRLAFVAMVVLLPSPLFGQDTGSIVRVPVRPAWMQYAALGMIFALLLALVAIVVLRLLDEEPTPAELLPSGPFCRRLRSRGARQAAPSRATRPGCRRLRAEERRF